jgi:hypothetical protein
MTRFEVINLLKKRLDNLQRQNLIVLVLPVRFGGDERQIAQELGVEVISLVGLLVERFGKIWDRLVRAEREGDLKAVSDALGRMLTERVQAASNGVLIADTEVLWRFPDLPVITLLMPLSEERLILLPIRGERVGIRLHLLGGEIAYDISHCTVLEVS